MSVLSSILVFVVIFLLPILVSFLLMKFFEGDVFHGDLDYIFVGSEEEVRRESYVRKGVLFDCEDEKCHGHLYVPNDLLIEEGETEPSVIIIMSHGFGATKRMGLEKYAEIFVVNGERTAVFTFDYRTFGESTGLPRNIVSPKEHVNDLFSAIHHVHDVFPTSKIVLWGSSLSGGHVLVAGGSHGNLDKEVIAIISQAPHLNGLYASYKQTLEMIKSIRIFDILKMISAASMDSFLSFLGLGPVSLRMLSYNEDEVALMRTEKEDFLQFTSLFPENEDHLHGWKNQCPARVVFEFFLYNPTDYVKKITLPVLFITGENDILCPSEMVKNAYETQLEKNEKSRLEVLSDVNHFQMYSDENIKKTCLMGLEFIKNIISKTSKTNVKSYL